MSPGYSSEQLVLETERLIVRTLAAPDAERMARYVVDNREHFEATSPIQSERYYTAEFWAEHITHLQATASLDSSLHLVFLRKGDTERRIMGKCAFSAIARGPMQAAYLGYGLARDAVGQGLMHEGLTVAIRYAFGPLNLHRIMANYMPGNVRSGAVLERLGFVIEGHAKDYLRINGRWEDHVLTSLTNDAWQPDAG